MSLDTTENKCNKKIEQLRFLDGGFFYLQHISNLAFCDWMYDKWTFGNIALNGLMPV
jgi:hypothetical protein